MRLEEAKNVGIIPSRSDHFSENAYRKYMGYLLRIDYNIRSNY